MTTQTVGLRRTSLTAAGPALLIAAPVAAILAGLASHWWEPRLPLLIPVGLAVLATSFAIVGEGRGWPAFWVAVAVGAATWGGVQCVYVLAHLAVGEPFDAERFGSQWAQALALIAAHAVFLGVPTGAVAGLLLNAPPLRGIRLRPG